MLWPRKGNSPCPWVFSTFSSWPYSLGFKIGIWVFATDISGQLLILQCLLVIIQTDEDTYRFCSCCLTEKPSTRAPICIDFCKTLRNKEATLWCLISEHWPPRSLPRPFFRLGFPELSLAPQLRHLELFQVKPTQPRYKTSVLVAWRHARGSGVHGSKPP